MNKLYRCHNCHIDFYTDDGLARHQCPGRDFETNLIGTQKRLQALDEEVARVNELYEISLSDRARLSQENKELQLALECIKIITDIALGESDGDGRRESDGGSQQGTD